jgi:hypothetical protein
LQEHLLNTMKSISMKKIAASIVLLLMVITINIANGQLKIEVKAGVNLATVNFENFDTKNLN